MNTQSSDQKIKCPKLDFTFTGQCPFDRCVLWHRPEGSDRTGCLKLDAGVSSGLNMTTAINSRLLTFLTKSEDPQQQLDASKILLHFGLLFGLNMIEYQSVDYALCKCGARESTCGHNGACGTRKQWAEWLLKLFAPFNVLNERINKRELNNLMLRTLLQYRKTNKLPALLEENMPTLALSKRIL